MSDADIAELARGVRGGERRAVAKAITLVESRSKDDQVLAEALLSELAPSSGRATRLGVSGPPGAGKSTLIDALGRFAIAQGHRVGVLAVDPTSQKSGGSLLGDRTRMARLGAEPEAFVRPSPSSGAAGGLGRRTREAMLVLEAAGYDRVIVESVGVGQAELGVTEVSDLVLLVLIAGAGDDVQGIKRGLLEHADLIAFSKADGANLERTLAAASELESLLLLLRGPSARVLSTSALESRGIDELGLLIEQCFAKLAADGSLEARRAAQRKAWFRAAVLESLSERVADNPELWAERSLLEAKVESGELLPPVAARRLVELL